MPLPFLLALLFLAVPAHGQAGVQAAAEALLAERFPQEQHRLAVRVTRTGGGFDATAPLRVRLRADGTVPKGATQVDVLLGSADGWTKAGWALLYVAHFDSVAVPRADLRADTPVADADLNFAWMETTRFSGEPLRPTDLRALPAARFATRTLRQGKALRHGDLRPPYAADTGDKVVMRYQRGPITLDLSCKAREPGFPGEVIRLYAPDTDTVYRARLTSPGRAEWIETK